ncbi:hypothetical protein Fuma_02321 [Fuerstiella marisgermanici]|uniref:Uncharacterized protein n=1 Tax=Fuerstiella marisgermanici TaxID=1891926 RepID=A0A1P8WF86_9PLAN|nr:hypothetical protein Fuma_01543 [Fuerstiella marisgermanici]APZ92709.1 hypothetical protein Fuma_02321 [Fuerstiella marisgermanici]
MCRRSSLFRNVTRAERLVSIVRFIVVNPLFGMTKRHW